MSGKQTPEAGKPNRDFDRLYWHSRRGMLELEYVLVPFVQDCYASLSDEDKAAYRELLESEDWEIFDWLQGREPTPNEGIGRVVAQINAYNDRPR